MYIVYAIRTYRFIFCIFFPYFRTMYSFLSFYIQIIIICKFCYVFSFKYIIIYVCYIVNMFLSFFLFLTSFYFNYLLWISIFEISSCFFKNQFTFAFTLMFLNFNFLDLILFYYTSFYRLCNKNFSTFFDNLLTKGHSSVMSLVFPQTMPLHF